MAKTEAAPVSRRPSRTTTSSKEKTNNIYAYEAVVIMDPDASLEAQKELFRRNQKIIEAHSGQVHHIDTWGKRALGNPIDRKPRGIYFHSSFTADNKAIAELERTMRINDLVMRFIHTRLDDDVDLATHLENFKKELAAGQQREREREAKMFEKRQQSRRFEQEEEHE